MLLTLTLLYCSIDCIVMEDSGLINLLPFKQMLFLSPTLKHIFRNYLFIYKSYSSPSRGQSTFTFPAKPSLKELLAATT